MDSFEKNTMEIIGMCFTEISLINIILYSPYFLSIIFYFLNFRTKRNKSKNFTILSIKFINNYLQKKYNLL